MDTAEERRGPGLLEAAWRYRWLVVLAAVCAGLAGWFASALQPVRYEATASLLLADPRGAGVFPESDRTSGDPARHLRNQAALVTSTPVLERAQELLADAPPVSELRERVSAEPSDELDLIAIRAADPSAAGAAGLADAVAQAYQDVSTRDLKEQAEAAMAELEAARAQLQARVNAVDQAIAAGGDPSLQAEREAAVTELIALEGRSRQIAVEAALYGSGVELFERAEIPEAPAQPQPVANVLLASVLGAMAAAGLAWWRAERTQSADDPHDAGPCLRAPLLGEVPEFKAVGVPAPIPMQSAPTSAAAEAYHFLVASLELSLNDRGGTAVLVTSAGPSDGKTVTALNVAIAAARDGRRVMLIDADLRRRGLTALSRTGGRPGLTEAAGEWVAYDSCVTTLAITERVRLPFIPAGASPDDCAGFFRTPGFRKALVRAREHADLLVIDSPPLLAVADTSAIASQADGLLVVVNRGAPLRQLEEARQRLEFIGTPVLGYVFNRSVPRRGLDYGYGEAATAGHAGRRAHARRGWRRRRQQDVVGVAPPGP